MIDLTNRICAHCLGHGTPTRKGLLAEYHLRAPGVAAVWIDVSGHVGAQEVASIENEPDRIVYCCERGHHFILAYRLGDAPPPAAIL
jgi:hypothetical protein